MKTVELSLCFNPDQESSHMLELLRSSADRSLADLQVDIHPMLWDGYKQEITMMALHNRGSDVSQVGFPLTDDLIAMNALQPAWPQLLAKIGGEAGLHPTLRRIAQRHQTDLIWGLPWMVDPRALFYWKDMVDAAGVNAETAFQTAEGMQAACQSMKDRGIEVPWVLGTADKFVIIHSVVSWVWGKGGDFISPDDNRAMFLDEAALNGLEAYFRLAQYTPNAGRPLSVAEAKRLFVERKAAITMGPYGSLHDFLASTPPALHDLLGIALPPGPPLIAGSDLVLWRHSQKSDEIARLLTFLFSTSVQVNYAEYLGDLPVTSEALDHLARSTDSNLRTFITTLDKGRIFSTTKFAGMLEVHLAATLTRLWLELSEHPAHNLREYLREGLDPVQRKFHALYRT
ncbi:MAG TPA: extracellular solute-binding protein [Anaerolineales bacterium]|nr:extracellular solute-binding protein [Anaerolineales bacterium]